MGNLKKQIALLLLTFIFFLSSSVAPVLAAVSYQYDANGNMTSDGTNCYEYNEENQLKKVKNCSNNQTIAEYVYDYQGNRLVKKEYSGGALQKTVYSPRDDYETVKPVSGPNQNTTYYFANDELLAKKNPDGTKNFYHNDHLGSTNILTSQSGALVEETKYDPWGELFEGGQKSKFLYTGQEKDLETGLNYYNARYYNSHIRRFTQPDDIIQNIYDPQSLNRYSYVNNNPIKYTDPSGHCVGIFRLLAPYCSQALSALTRYAQSATNFATKVATQKAAQKTSKIIQKNPANPTTSKITDTASKVVDNSSTKIVSDVGNITKSQSIISNTFWPGPENGRVVLNGLEYTKHALFRMQPRGFVYKEDPLKGTIGTLESRGIPPSVVENAIEYGVKVPNGPDKIMHIYENIKVVTDKAVTRIITVMD